MSPAPRIACARCASANDQTSRFCDVCGLPLGVAEADIHADLDLLVADEPAESMDASLDARLLAFARSSGREVSSFGHGWRLVVPLVDDRRQAVYLGRVGTGDDGQPVLGVLSVCGPASERSARDLLKLNGRVTDGTFAIRVLRGEEYFVVVRCLALDELSRADPRLFDRVAQLADRLEERLSRGGDLY